MSKPIDTDAVRARYSSGFTYADTPGEIRALANEIDRLRAENEHARQLAERYLAEKGRAESDVAAMLPIVEAVRDAVLVAPDSNFVSVGRGVQQVARRFLDARKVGP